MPKDHIGLGYPSAATPTTGKCPRSGGRGRVPLQWATSPRLAVPGHDGNALGCPTYAERRKDAQRLAEPARRRDRVALLRHGAAAPTARAMTYSLPRFAVTGTRVAGS